MTDIQKSYIEESTQKLVHLLHIDLDLTDTEWVADSIAKAVLDAGWMPPALPGPQGNLTHELPGTSDFEGINDLEGEYVEVVRTYRGRFNVAGTSRKMRLKLDTTGGQINLDPQHDRYRKIDDPITVPDEQGIYLFGNGDIIILDADGDWTRPGSRYIVSDSVVRKAINNHGAPKKLEAKS